MCDFAGLFVPKRNSARAVVRSVAIVLDAHVTHWQGEYRSICVN